MTGYAPCTYNPVEAMPNRADGPRHDETMRVERDGRGGAKLHLSTAAAAHLPLRINTQTPSTIKTSADRSISISWTSSPAENPYAVAEEFAAYVVEAVNAYVPASSVSDLQAEVERLTKKNEGWAVIAEERATRCAKLEAALASTAQMREALKLARSDATYHLSRYRPHVLEAIDAALSQAPEAGDAVRVAVKPLEWTPVSENGADRQAETHLGLYVISADELIVGVTHYLWMAGQKDDDEHFSAHRSMAHAKAAAQADFERRVRSAIVPAGKRDFLTAPIDAAGYVHFDPATAIVPAGTAEPEVERLAKLCPCEATRERGTAIMCLACTGPMGEENARAALGRPA